MEQIHHRKKHIGMAFIGAIVILAIFILVKDEWQSILLQNSSYGMPALIKDGYVRELYIGSSMFRQGIEITDNRLYEQYILAYNGNDPALEYYELKKLIDNGVVIDNLYVDMYAYSLCKEPSLSDEKILMETNISDKWNIYQLIKNSTDQGTAFWRIFVSANNDMMFTYPISSAVINSRFERGGTLQKSSSAGDSLHTMNIPFLNDEVNQKQIEYLRKLIKLAHDNNINLYFVETPKYQSVTTYQNYISVMGKYLSVLGEVGVSMIMCEDTLNEIENQEDGIFSSNMGLISTYSFDNSNTSFFSDTVHLSSEGRESFTKIINNIY